MSAAAIIPPDPTYGAALSHHPSDRLRPLIVAALIGVPIMGAMALLLLLVPDWWAPVVAAFITATVGLALGWYVLHGWNREVILYERGFSYRQGSKTIYFAYAEIHAIRLQAERRAYFGGLLRLHVYRFTVTTNQEEQFVITNLYRRAAELGTRLQERVFAYVRPTLERRLANGERVSFGVGLSLNADGLQHGEQSLAWNHFGGIRASGGRLILSREDGDEWFSAPLREIDNLPLLIEQIKRYERRS